MNCDLGRAQMRNGHCSICLSADGYAGSGTMDLRDRRGTGHDGAYEVQLQLDEDGPRSQGNLRIVMDSGVVRNARMPGGYTLVVTGSSVDDAFNLIGVGPLGMIISLLGKLA